MEQPFSTSKVTVEYSDPHGVYKLVAPGLVPQLPLRNLHWQSHAGPLRSIDTLHVELLPAGSTDPRPILSPDPFFPTQQRRDSSTARADDGFQTQIGGGGGGGLGVGVGVSGAAVSSTSIDRIASSGHRDSTPARRHQIPGLRRTPYLKVLLVRCDDNDTYKASVRQEIRDWIKANTPPSGSKKSTAENHDAFEWLVLHVVLPNTVAATQPRITGKSETSEKTSTASRWRPGSSTLLEKLRSDFSSSSKGGADRVAQVRIGVNDVPYDLLPRVVPAMPSGYKESPEESENAWVDLLSKFRSLILASFDSRVTQYEEDIKEKDAQRSLPGWNFCTFFILKEGLARGFESVGLVEDALVGYDELSVGLDMIIQDQAEGGSGTAANTLLGFTEELRQQAVKAKAAVYGDGDGDEVVDMQAPGSATGGSSDEFDEIPISPTKKPYRELILENNVSVFDFRCYIFARQIALLLRLGNAWSTREDLLAKLKEQQDSVLHGVVPRPPPKQTEPEHENLSMLAEICRRTLEFIPAVSQVMRRDVLSALSEEATPTTLDPAVAEIADNLVASFAFSIAQQVLAQTSTKALPIPPSTLAPPDGHEPKSAIPEPKTMMHPARSSSLRISTGSSGAGRPPPSPNFFPGPGRSTSSEETGSRNHAFLKVGLEDLAARRAELYAFSRNILEESGKKRGWSDGWAGVPVVGERSMIDLVEIDLSDDTMPTANESGEESDGAVAGGLQRVVSLAGVESALLRAALDNSDDFYRLYETLTDKALRHYTVANHTHSVQANMADLAVLKYHMGDYGAASSYFWRTTPFYGESGWSLLELSMLVMYSRCLRELKRKDEFTKVVLKLLAKSAAAERERQSQGPASQFGRKSDVDYPDSDAIKGFLEDLLVETKSLGNEVRVPLASFFHKVELDGTLEYHEGQDSFSVYLKLSSLLIDELKLDKARARMAGTVAGVQREIWLELAKPMTIKPGRNQIRLDSNVVIPGTYDVDKIELSASNLVLHFERDVSGGQSQMSLSSNSTAGAILKAPKITIYHRAGTLGVQLTPSSNIQLDQNNTVDIDLDSGWNNILNAEVKVRAATGGLRLLTSAAKIINSSSEFSKAPEGGLFCFGGIPSHKAVKIRFPYTVEQEVLQVSVRIEVTYTTEHGTFTLSKTPSIPIALALGVNVQDVFKHDALFSRFTVSTASSSPLRLFKSELVGSDIFESNFGIPPAEPIVVFPRQPASLLYRIKRKKGVKSTPKMQKTLYLKLHYGVVQDDISSIVEKSIADTLRDNPLAGFTRLLVETVLPHVQTDLDSIDLERAALLGSVSTEFLSSVSWTKELAGLGRGPDGKDLAATLSEILRAWQSSNPTLAVSQGKPTEPRTILIPVDVPPITIVHTADIRLSPPATAVPSSQVNGIMHKTKSAKQSVTTNQLLPATLHLQWTRIWDTATPVKEMADLEFSYEVIAAGDSWLVGGRRKGHFVIPAPDSEDGKGGIGMNSTEETEADIPLLLIPLREGWLPYPSIDIREVRPAESGGGTTPVEGPSSTGNGELVEKENTGHCETDYRNLGETVRVVADREKVTLSLDASGSGGGPLVLDVEKRGRDWARVVA